MLLWVLNRIDHLLCDSMLILLWEWDNVLIRCYLLFNIIKLFKFLRTWLDYLLAARIYSLRGIQNLFFLMQFIDIYLFYLALWSRIHFEPLR